MPFVSSLSITHVFLELGKILKIQKNLPNWRSLNLIWDRTRVTRASTKKFSGKFDTPGVSELRAKYILLTLNSHKHQGCKNGETRNCTTYNKSFHGSNKDYFKEWSPF